MDGAVAPWHVVVVLLLFMVLFGAKRLPDSARSLGQALRIFKAETRAMHLDGPTRGAEVISNRAAPTDNP